MDLSSSSSSDSSSSSMGSSYLQGNWRPFNATRFDNNKTCGNLLLDDLHAREISAPFEPTKIFEIDGDIGIYTVNLGTWDFEGSFVFPKDLNVKERFNGMTNKVLYDIVNKKTYHIAYLDYDSSDILQPFLLAYIYFDPNDTDNFDVWDIANIAGYDVNPLQILDSGFRLSKDILNSFDSNKHIVGVDDCSVKRMIDIREEGTYSDLLRYIDENSKIFFRVRPVIAKNLAPASYEDQDTSSLQYIGEEVLESPVDKWVNYPWSDDGVTYEYGFEWGITKLINSIRRSIRPIELPRKFGITYFKCASK